MKTWEEVVCKAKELANAAGRKAVDVADLAKMKIKMADNDRAIEATMEALGRILYESRHSEEPMDEEMLAELISQADELNAMNDELQSAIDNTRGRKTCAACGAVNAEGALFCNQCGKEL